MNDKNETISDKQALNFILYGQIASGILSNSNYHFATADDAADYIHSIYSATVARFHKNNKPVEKSKNKHKVKYEQESTK